MFCGVEKGLVEGGDGSIKRESMEGSDRRVALQLRDELVVLSCFFCWHEMPLFLITRSEPGL